MKRLAFLLTGAVLHAPLLHAQDVDPRSMALNHCYVVLMNTRPYAKDPWKDPAFWQCMGNQGFMFCQDCRVFADGPLCRDDRANGPDRSNCWRHMP
jgi:hypothetical protein